MTTKFKTLFLDTVERRLPIGSRDWQKVAQELRSLSSDRNIDGPPIFYEEVEEGVHFG
jgi:hypothetical protein